MNEKQPAPKFTALCYKAGMFFLIFSLVTVFMNVPIPDHILPLVALAFMLIGHLSDSRYYW